MDPILTTKEIDKINLLTRIILILFGIFLTSTIFAMSVKIFSETGIWIGLAVSLILIFCGFYYQEPGGRFRVITWTMLVVLISVIILYYFSLSYFTKLFAEAKPK